MNNMLPTPYQQFIHKSRYARWLDANSVVRTGMRQCPGTQILCVIMSFGKTSI